MEIHVHHCSVCDKYYQTDITDYVPVNSNISCDVIHIILKFVKYFQFKKNICLIITEIIFLISEVF